MENDADKRIALVEKSVNDILVTQNRHSERLQKIEGKLLNDWNRLGKVETDLENLKMEVVKNSETSRMTMEKVDEMGAKMNRIEEDMKLRDIQVTKTMKRQTKWLIVTASIAIVALVYGTIQNGTTASAISTLVATLAKIGLVT